MSVAAQTIDQSMPCSNDAKIDSPTVKGRVFTELVITRGHKKLFQ